MALQGTLDTFELPDVLRLLASTRKTGRLTLRGDRGEGDVWLAEGALVGVAVGGRDADVGDALFELLRAHEGSFAFAPGEEPATPVPPADVEPLLVAAEELLVEWREIEAVVPSLDAWVALQPELPGPEITVDAATWRLVATVGSGVSVAELGDALGLGEVAVSRLVRDLVDLGLGTVAAAPAHRSRPAAPDEAPVEAPVGELAPVEAFDAREDVGVADVDAHLQAGAGDRLDGVVEHAEDAYEPASLGYGYADERASLVDTAPAPAPLFGADAPLAYADDPEPVAFVPEPADDAASPFSVAPAGPDDEIARQLAMLSPQAAQAVAAAAAGGEAGGADGGDDLADDGDEPVNRGLLLKFLSSVKA